MKVRNTNYNMEVLGNNGDTKVISINNENGKQLEFGINMTLKMDPWKPGVKETYTLTVCIYDLKVIDTKAVSNLYDTIMNVAVAMINNRDFLNRLVRLPFNLDNADKKVIVIEVTNDTNIKNILLSNRDELGATKVYSDTDEENDYVVMF